MLVTSFVNGSKSVFEFLTTFFKHFITKTCMAKSNQKSESASFRNFRDFFSDISMKMIDFVEKNLGVVLYMLDSPNYMLRNSAVELLKCILAQNYSKLDPDDPNLSQKQAKKLDYINWILTRFLDQSPFSRNQVLVCVSELYSIKIFSED